MLKEATLFGEIDKVGLAIERLRQFEPPEGYYLAFSGGKDSVVIKRLAEMSRVKFDAHYNLTTVDPPELVQFIRREHPEVEWDRPKETMWNLIVSNGIPPCVKLGIVAESSKNAAAKGDSQLPESGRQSQQGAVKGKWSKAVQRAGKDSCILSSIGRMKKFGSSYTKTKSLIALCMTKVLLA